MVAFTRSLAVIGWLHAGAAAALAHERFVAVETGAVLSPRQYHVSPGMLLGKRQGGSCAAGAHPCNEIGPAGANICCPNNQYCIINPTAPSEAGCCRIGSRCSSPCLESQYQCNDTSTVTQTQTLTSPQTTTTITTTSLLLIPACCPRSCTLPSQFRCPSSLGNGCCAHGATCVSGGLCVSTTPPNTLTGVSIAPEGCQTGQIGCAGSLGGGCCAATQSCTLYEGKAHCAEDPVVPSGEGVEVVKADGGALGSAGAKAGLAVGVVVGAGLVIGLVTWWVLRGRRRRRESEMGGTGTGSGGRSAGVVGRVVGGGGGGGRHGREMSEEQHSDVLSRSGRLGGLAQDYFGPAPAVGPYSETHSTSRVTTPGVDRGGVPLQPHEPGDIAVPVEIDSRLTDTRRTPPAALAISPGGATSPSSDDGLERFELYGSEVGSPTLPSPFGMPSPAEERHR